MIKKIVSLIGIDQAIFFNIISKVVQSCGGLIILLFISKFLNISEQGYYYTFGSLLALQLFFELGLGSIIVQYTAYEKAYLEWNGDVSMLRGNHQNLARLSSLLHLFLKWYLIVSFSFFILLCLSGIAFFSYYSDLKSEVSWSGAWVLIVSVTSLNLFISPFVAMIEGLGKIREIAKMRVGQQTIQILLISLALYGGYGLYAAPIGYLGAFTFFLFWVVRNKYVCLFRYLWKEYNPMCVISWKKEIFPYQWRIALSWMSGYLIYQLFNPVIFAVDGAVNAGKMGMTLTVLNGINSIAYIWMGTKIPIMSGYISTKKYDLLDQLYHRTFRQALGVCLVCLLSFLFLLLVLNECNSFLINRLLPIENIIPLAVLTFTNQIIFYQAAYLRCFKREPYLYQALVTGILVASSTIVFGYLGGLNGIVYGYAFISVFIALPWSLFIFKKKHYEWHE